MSTANSIAQSGVNLPEPGPQKRDPAKADRMLDEALQDSMAASDPPQITQPDVKLRGLEALQARVTDLKTTANSAFANHPMKSIGVIAGLGLLLGLLLTRR